MLSRTASHLYWMSRYLERAENLARALDVSRELALLPQGRDLKEDIAIPLALTGTRAAFLAVHRDITPAGLWQTLGFSLDEPASIACCLKRARENAHAVRGSITADTWETLNTTWLEMKSLRKKGVNGEALLAELAQVEEQVNRQLADWLAAGGEIRRSRAGEAIIDSRYWHGVLEGRELTIPCGGTHVGSLAELGQVQVQLAPCEEGFILTTRVTP